MTDPTPEERARKISDEWSIGWGSEIEHNPDVWPDLEKRIAEALSAAESRGEARGLQRAAEIAADHDGWQRTCDIIELIRALAEKVRGNGK